MGNYAKAIIAVLLAAAGTAQTVISSDGQISPQGWISIVISALTVAGVYAIPNHPSVPKPTITVLSEQNEKLVP